jgi:hypothetical protein
MGTYIDSNFVFHGYLRTPDGNTVTVDPLGSVFTALRRNLNNSSINGGFRRGDFSVRSGG